MAGEPRAGFSIVWRGTLSCHVLARDSRHRAERDSRWKPLIERSLLSVGWDLSVKLASERCVPLGGGVLSRRCHSPRGSYRPVAGVSRWGWLVSSMRHWVVESSRAGTSHREIHATQRRNWLDDFAGGPVMPPGGINLSHKCCLARDYRLSMASTSRRCRDSIQSVPDDGSRRPASLSRSGPARFGGTAAGTEVACFAANMSRRNARR